MQQTIAATLLVSALAFELAGAWTQAAGRWQHAIGIQRHALSSPYPSSPTVAPRMSKQDANNISILKKPPIKGLLFDCDGTLVDSMPMWANNWVQTCAEFGIDLDEARFFKLAGMTIEDTLKHLSQEQGKEVDEKEFFRRKDQLSRESIKLVREIYPVAQAARDGYGVYKMAVVSSGPRAMVEQFLQQTNLRHLFEVMVCAEDVMNHKPHPEPFLIAAQKLGVELQTS